MACLLGGAREAQLAAETPAHFGDFLLRIRNNPVVSPSEVPRAAIAGVRVEPSPPIVKLLYAQRFNRTGDVAGHAAHECSVLLIKIGEGPRPMVETSLVSIVHVNHPFLVSSQRSRYARTPTIQRKVDTVSTDSTHRTGLSQSLNPLPGPALASTAVPYCVGSTLCSHGKPCCPHAFTLQYYGAGHGFTTP